jgi:hypothetical protein
LIDPSLLGAVDAVGFGTVGVVTVGTAGAVGAAPAAVSDALIHEHASAPIGRAKRTSKRRRHIAADARGRGFGTETLSGS